MLFVVCWSVLVARWSLFVVRCCLPFAARFCLLLLVCVGRWVLLSFDVRVCFVCLIVCLLFVVCCLLFVAYCLPFVAFHRLFLCVAL